MENFERAENFLQEAGSIECPDIVSFQLFVTDSYDRGALRTCS